MVCLPESRMRRTGMVLQTILEGLGLVALLVLVCAVGICKGAVGMVHLYSPAVLAAMMTIFTH